MIPPLNARGLLPDGVHASDEDEVAARFGAASARRRLVTGFFRLRREAEEYGLAGLQWLDGSFVTSKESPRDIDVVTFCDYALLNQRGAAIKEFYSRALSAQAASIPTYGCDTYAVPACGPNHPYYPVFEKWRAYWRKHFAQVYDSSSGNIVAEDKGFVSLSLGDSNLICDVSTRR